MARFYKIKRRNRYVKGTIGMIIPLSFTDKVKILFSKGINVVLVEPRRRAY